MQIPPTKISRGKEKGVAKKSRMQMRDLPPRKNARGGGGITRNDPPLPIPPPGFVVASEDEKKQK